MGRSSGWLNISYLTSRPSRDLLVAAHQSVTHDWWETHRCNFGLLSSELVVAEARLGDPDAARRRLVMIGDLPFVTLTPEALELARLFVRHAFLPREAMADSTHIALAIVHGLDYLLTWNCRHIANALVRASIGAFCADRGLRSPTVCTPEELIGE